MWCNNTFFLNWIFFLVLDVNLIIFGGGGGFQCYYDHISFLSLFITIEFSDRSFWRLKWQMLCAHYRGIWRGRGPKQQGLSKFDEKFLSVTSLRDQKKSSRGPRTQHLAASSWSFHSVIAVIKKAYIIKFTHLWFIIINDIWYANTLA